VEMHGPMEDDLADSRMFLDLGEVEADRRSLFRWRAPSRHWKFAPIVRYHLAPTQHRLIGGMSPQHQGQVREVPPRTHPESVAPIMPRGSRKTWRLPKTPSSSAPVSACTVAADYGMR
jgi:hypothetical protein